MTENEAPMNEKKSLNRRRRPVIDCDIHNNIPSAKTLHPYLSERWRNQLEMVGTPSRIGSAVPRGMPYAARSDAWPPSGKIPGSDLAFMPEQLLDRWNLEYGVLNCLSFQDMLNAEQNAALARAANDWQIDAWLEPESRLRASMLVAFEDGELAAEEIERLGDTRGFVQILLLARTVEPLGRRRYWKIYEAAVRHDLPIGIHFGGVGVGPITSVGRPSYFIEDHGGMSGTFQTQVTSLVCEGVFEHFPTLKIVLIEGGFAWLAPLMWRLDRAWKMLREEVPYLKRPPSEYIREHFWISTQPAEEPPKQEYFQQLLDHINADEKLMFATDYPHWDFDSPDHALPNNLNPDLKWRIMAENARALYQL